MHKNMTVPMSYSVHPYTNYLDIYVVFLYYVVQLGNI